MTRMDKALIVMVLVDFVLLGAVVIKGFSLV